MTRFAMTRWLLATAALALAMPTLTGSASSAAPTDPDLGFGTRGLVTVSAGPETCTADLAVQPEGGVVSVGATVDGKATDGLVFRLDSRGRFDQAFGTPRLGVDGYSAAAKAVAVRPDGRIVVVGDTNRNDDIAVWQLLPDGRPDAGFGSNGLFTIDSGRTERAYAVAIAPNGQVVVAGGTDVGGNDQMTVYRLTTDGRMDATFDGDGALGFGGPGSDTALAVAVQPDGKILVTGADSTDPTARVYRLDTTGQPDATWGTAGVATLPDTENHGYDLAVLPDGRVYALALARDGVSYSAAVFRLTSAGATDSTFGGATGAHVDFGGEDFLRSLIVTPRGQVVVGGLADGRPAIARLTDAGVPDATFGTNGKFRLPSGLSKLNAIAVQPDGHVLAGGYISDDDSAFVYRMLGDAKPLSCAGRAATIVGTDAKDLLKGTPGSDVIVALGGNDVVRAKGGNDVICGAAGKDQLYGGAGRDRLVGGPGKDQLYGGAGRDRLVGGPGKDVEFQGGG